MATGVIRAVVGAAALTAAISACASSDQPSARPPAALTLTTYDGPSTPGGALVAHFIEEVEAADPSITITPQFAAAPQEPDAVTAVSNGSADLVMVASRAFDTAGVTTLQVLNTPFLIDSNVLANAVATSTHVPALLAGLDDIGVVGLAIAPEGMRHLFADGDPPVEVRDMEGVTVRSPQSQVVWSFLAATGATPIFDDTRAYDVAESQFDQASLGSTAGNLALFPKYDVLAINEKAARDLSPAQMEALRAAATESASWAVERVESDHAMAAAFCENGGRIVAATPVQLQEWRDVARPVVEDLRSEPSTAELLDAIRAMKDGVVAEPTITGCANTLDPVADQRLNGTYTFTATTRAFKAVGLHDQGFIDLNSGDYRMTLEDGTITKVHHFTSGPRSGERESDTHTYTLEGDTMTIRWSPQPGDYTSATVTVLPDGSLQFSDWVEGLPEPKFLLQDQVVLRRWQRVDQ